MVNLTVYAGLTWFTGPREELKAMCKSLRVSNPNGYWAARMFLKRHAYLYHDKEKVSEIENRFSWIRFYDWRKRTFLSGLLTRVTNCLDKCEIKYQIEDKRRKLEKLPTIKELGIEGEQRPEQIAAVNAALKYQRGILALATNAGKTNCAAAIIRELLYAKPTRSILFLVHRIGLAKQTKDRFVELLGSPIWMLGAGKHTIPAHGVLVSTIQTMHNCLENRRAEALRFLEKCDAVFVDELHINKAYLVTDVMSQCSAPMRIGLSGTISRQNKIKYMHYRGLCGPILSETSNKELVDLGRSAKPFIRFIKITEPEVTSGSYREAYRLGVVLHNERNRSIVNETGRYLNQGKNVLITVARKAHGFELLRRLRGAFDVPAAFILGSTPLYIRDKAAQSFRSGRVPILIVSPIGDVGWDLPEIETWINAAAGKGWELVLQRLGRTLRRKAGVNKVYISDFLDYHNEYLRKHSKLRLKYYRAEDIAEIKCLSA
jgi:superfamily II DNA or RNA helicase